ncbi:hypothetical protein SYJ56_18885 [Algoriphagus sp. D3-2-R+10]|uniref:GH39 family glycosyl hydrolase n=1 Tax=Algoriphagus aurantiacus TaxID=3103948 RepID=UPI002B38B5B6|nr:hypothetical protein [Algoriphagus sp. D3-2-R+10]MEB2777387.1 hypothetical protein [Algoriphagus sp. D3-2-R+10]
MLLILANINNSFGQEEFPFKEIGQLDTKSANEIKSSRWSIGGETLDRDYADYDSYKEYLGPLGAKRIRLQGGWAKCEKVKGVYDFSWMDSIVDDALAQGVHPWIQTSYGNPIYEGGGEPALAGGIPTSDEALLAWDKWVEAIVSRYKDRVTEWEIWNEPDISKRFTSDDFAIFHVRTADIIRKIQPDSRIIALGLAGLRNVEYVRSILDILEKEDRLDQFDILTFHGYTARPEAIYGQVENLRTLVKSYREDIELWQGENGAPSTAVGTAVGAMSKEGWSEISQAKYVLRRMAGDMGNEIDVTSVFQISDMNYKAGDHMSGLNSKGLLQANSDNSIVKAKLSYYAYQNMATIFSGDISVAVKVNIKTNVNEVLVYAFQSKQTKANSVAYWDAEKKPTDELSFTKVTLSNMPKFKNPVLVNPFTGKVYEIPADSIGKGANGWDYKNMPAGDWPLLILEKNWIELQ